VVQLKDIVKAFIAGISRSRVSLLGAMLTTVVFPFLLGAVILDMFGYVENPYFGFVVYLVMGPAFIAGLVMVFIGLFFLKGKEEVRLFTLDYLREHFNDPVRFSRIRKLLFLGVFLTGLNIFIVSLLGYSGYHYMESVSFCGQFCHTVMNPEYSAYQNSPHSRVACVECHIGSGAQWFVKSKISGARQLYAVAFDTHSRPIETPVHGLRPARETCEQCHRPELFHGEKLVVREKFLPDEENTNVHTVLLMKVGSAGDRTVSSHGIHWHVAPENRVVYKATDHSRATLPEVTLVEDGDKETHFVSGEAPPEGEVRTMDCIDCHNRPSHVFVSADEALDRKLQEGAIPRELPFIKRQALEAVNRDYASTDAAMAGIASELTTWYRDNLPLSPEQKPLLTKAIAGVQKAYGDNVFPEMNIAWDTYARFIGHGPDFDTGCFRCHDGEHETADGEVISADCDTCHVILAEEEHNPEILQTLQGE